jgi:uncharacterized repeat protein (TIGR04076 family)
MKREGDRAMKIEELGRIIQTRLGYTDLETEQFMENPRNIDILSKSEALMKKTIIFEVVESHGCASQHKIGDRFHFDGAGNLITSMGPKKICCFALESLTKPIFAAQELFYAGIDPGEMRFKRTSCFDVGLKCGGWGQIVMEIKVADRGEP